ncbi:MAG: hypothetical protein ACJ8EY_05360, partial [Sphingomicrobium sp.]
MKTFLLGGVAAILMASVAPAIAQAPVPGARAAKLHTRAEVTAKVQQHFARVDANKDGAITQAELQSAQARKGDWQAKRAERAGKRGNGEGFFARLDANKDGNVTRAEFDAARAQRAQRNAANPAQRSDRGQEMFARLDTNRDGAINRAEFDAGRQQRAQRVAQRAEGQHKGRGGHGQMGAHMFTMADANKD